MSSAYYDIPTFVDYAVASVGRAASRVRMKRTIENRVLRRFSVAETAEILGCDRSLLYTMLKWPDAPSGDDSSGKLTLSVTDIAKLRALSASRPGARMPMLFWRKPGDKLPVISISSQKGGTAKSVTAAHLGQYLALYYGLRVGIIDADPQATCSLYYVDGQTEFGGGSVATFSDFMGVPPAGSPSRIVHPKEALNGFWLETPWPGIRLIPGGAEIQESDIAMFWLRDSGNAEDRLVYRMLRDTLHRWEKFYPPDTQPEDLRRPDGSFDERAYKAALTETFDVVIIDTAPSLTIAQLNAVVAADTLIIPQTMKGFDLSTLHIYLNSLNDAFAFLRRQANPVEFPKSGSFILPTIVARNNDTDLRTIGEIYSIDRRLISPIFYKQSDGAANAFREYKSAYEFQPDRARRVSIQSFVQNANAVNDAIVMRALPHLPSRGFAEKFIKETYQGGIIPMWSQESGSAIKGVAA